MPDIRRDEEQDDDFGNPEGLMTPCPTCQTLVDAFEVQNRMCLTCQMKFDIQLENHAD